MEKFSAYRDPGTGIQPFLPPVPPSENDLFVTLLMPVRGVLAMVRTALVAAIAFIHVLLHALYEFFIPIPSLRCRIGGGSTMLLSRLALYVLGFIWIPEEVVTRKRGQGPAVKWNPKAGDIIVSNWVSWTDVLWLAYRFNPIFIIPVSDNSFSSVPSPDGASLSMAYRPGRRARVGSDAVFTSNRPIGTREAIQGFRRVSLLSIIRATGKTPRMAPVGSVAPFETIRQSAERPIVVFPECTTSNGRGLLRFVNVFEDVTVPVKRFNVFVMCIRYGPPTSLQPSLAHPVPSLTMNPLRHLFTITTSMFPQAMSIRMLAPSESPSSQLFMANEVVTETSVDLLSEACAVLIAKIGKMKRVGFGWEDKTAFLSFYWGQRM
ncbi:hypothetical protein F5I97DRAFT_1863189 [Phlebopus sp. FC_14]|nr:hypothetical protein F5I97DRAFT_1863189 [Phlebopus sp. FC_14]